MLPTVEHARPDAPGSLSPTRRAALRAAPSPVVAAEVAARWTKRPWVPFGTPVEVDGADEAREAIRFEIAEEDGCYADVRAWTSREAFLAGLRLYLEHYPEALTGPNKNDAIKLDAFMQIIAITAAQAHPATGRAVRAYKRWVAQQAGCSEDKVQRAWRFATCRLDVLREIRRARPLHQSARLTVRQGHRMPDGTRCRQRGITPLRAFNVPDWLAPWVAIATQEPQDGPQQPITGPVDNDTTDAARGPQEASDESPTGSFASPPRRGQPFGNTHLLPRETCSHDAVSLRSTKQPRSARRLDEGGRPVRRTRLAGEELAAGIAALLGWSTTKHQDGPRLSPRMTAPALADFERAGWTPEHWLATARAVAVTLRYRWPTSSQQITSPGGWVRWLTQHMVPDEPVDVGADPAAPPWLTPCGQPGCDGHGWLTSDPDPVTGRVTSRKCPTCPPRIRVATPVQIEQRDLALTDYEPPTTVCVACRRPGPTVVARLASPLGSAVCDPCWQIATNGPGS